MNSVGTQALFKDKKSRKKKLSIGDGKKTISSSATTSKNSTLVKINKEPEPEFKDTP